MRLDHLSRMLVWVVFFACTTVAFAQDPLVVTYDQNIQQLSIGDIDFGDFGSSNFIFSLNVNYAGEVRLFGKIDIMLDDGSSYPDAAVFCTQPFTAPVSISNLDIGKNASIKTESFTFSQTVKDELQKKALAVGKLPSGEYSFLIQLRDAAQGCNSGGVYLDQEVIILTLRTISRLDLVYPPDGTTLNTIFPLFQWIYDGRDVELSVYERLPQHASKEEAASSVEHLLVRTNMTDLPPGTNSYQYPLSGVRPLEAGHTYVWKVKGISRGTGGSGSEINSEIWQFSIAENTSSTSSETQRQTVTNLLQFLNGLSQELLSQLLNGDLQLTGVILLDGRQLTAAEVIALLQELSQNPDKIISIQIVG